MQTRKLADWQINPIGLGCMAMSEFYGTSEEKVGIKTIHHALDKGVQLFDTADMYGTGRNEELLGKALKGRRDSAILATKFGINRGASTGTSWTISGHPDYVKSACEASLKRLGVESIDLYYQHRVDSTVPIEETVGAMAELVKEGKVKQLGLSEATSEQIRRAASVHPIAALQTEYSLWSREPENDLFQTCEELDITFVAYSPLGRGFLTGAIRSRADLESSDWRLNNPRFQDEALERNLELLKQLEALSESKGCTLAQLALGWILAKNTSLVTIPGTRKTERVDQNLGALNVVFSADEMKVLDEVMPLGAFAGARY